MPDTTRIVTKFTEAALRNERVLMILACLTETETERAILAAARRWLDGENLPPAMARREAKASLLIVRIYNPDEVLAAGEECIVRGVSDKTLRGMKRRGEIPQVCGGIK